jgi:hypothetical protein
MDHQSIARVLLASLCGLQGAATAAIDLNRTHAMHPGWLAHARFHVVWQTANVVFLSLFEMALVLVQGPFMQQRFYIAALLASAPMMGFFAALFTRRLYGGALSDPQGMPAWIVGIQGRQLRIDLNVVAEIMGLMSLGGIIAIYRAA